MSALRKACLLLISGSCQLENLPAFVKNNVRIVVTLCWCIFWKWSVCVWYTEPEEVQPGLLMISELIDEMMIHKSHLTAWSPGCAESGAEGEQS